MLFKGVRKKFKARRAIQLYDQSSTLEIVKSDRRIRDSGITDGMTLYVYIHPSKPEVFVIFVTLLNGAQITLSMTEVISYMY